MCSQHSGAAMDTVMTMLSLARDNRHEQIEKLSKQGLSVSVSNQVNDVLALPADACGGVQTADPDADHGKEALVQLIPLALCDGGVLLLQMGQTPLHIAALWGNVETVRTLARLGADVKAPNMR